MSFSLSRFLPVSPLRRCLLMVGAALVVLALGLYFTGVAAAGWQHVRAWRAERFVQAGYRAWQDGRIREAELSFQSAEALAPDHRRAALLHGRMLLQQRRREEGRAIFARLLARETGAQRQDSSGLYFDALLGSAWFEEVAAHVIRDYPGIPPGLQAQWASAAVEAVRIARLQPTATLAERPPSRHPVLELLLGAQLHWNAGRRELARAWLAAVPGPELSGSLQTSAVRLALQLGEPELARRLLASTAAPLTDADLAFHALWLDVATGAPGAANPPLVRAAFPAGIGGPALLARLGHLLPWSTPPLAAALAARFVPEAAQLTNEQLAALWLGWEVAGADARENPWRPLLSRRLHTELLPLGADPLTPTRYAGIVNTVPLARATVVSLLPLVPATMP